jgi:hypothetical protein
MNQRGASRSVRSISSMTGLYGSRAVGRGGSFFLGSGQAESTALRTVRHDTLYLRSIGRIFMPPRWSRRIAAYSSTFDICGMTRAFHAGLHPLPPRTPTLSVGMFNFIGQNSTAWTLVCAGSVITLLPIVLIFIVLQRFFINGLAGAVKQ